MSEEDGKRQGFGDPMGMGVGMAKKMMGQMGGDGPNPMAMMQKMMGQMAEGGEAPPPMMQMCMGMCGEMLTAIKRTTDMTAFASPELQGLFTEWLETLEDRAIRHLQENGATDLTSLAKALGIDTESASYLFSHLAKQGKITLRAELVDAS
tara:strand:- start:317 stop:769 length:453 start_codon:yes stop_codon:yes gene_type:complete